MSAAALSRAELAEMLRQTGRAHHAAFIETDGADPEWAIWYAGHLQALVGDRFGHAVTRSELTYLLVKGARDLAASGSTEAWPEFYAAQILDAVTA